MIEFEKVQLIRKRASTDLRHCDNCGSTTDSVSLLEAAALFETDPGDLFRFINENDGHHHVDRTSKIFLCVASLLDSMNQKNKIRRSLPEGK